MNPTYITGNGKYKSAVRKSLYKSSLKVGIDYIEGNSHQSNDILYWISVELSLREFKLAIGSKVIFKYRLQFSNLINNNSNNCNNTMSLSFNESEIDLLMRYRKKIWGQY